jgi:hypothetical protein
MVFPGYANAVAFTPTGEVVKKFDGDGDHFGNFVKAVRSRKVEDLNGDVLEGHLSSALCHLGNISYRLGDEQLFNKTGEAFGDDKDAAETLGRMMEHLKDNKVSLDEATCRVGKKVAVDPKTEAFVNDKKADEMLTREYRRGFEVPAKA